jgi:disulfide oxidoreductase YuzD
MFRSPTFSWTSTFSSQYISIKEQYSSGNLKSLFRKLSSPISTYSLILIQEMKVREGVKTWVRGVAGQKRVPERNSL